MRFVRRCAVIYIHTLTLTLTLILIYIFIFIFIILIIYIIIIMVFWVFRKTDRFSENPLGFKLSVCVIILLYV